MSFPRYERYKDSGIEWLGEVPEHWQVDRLKVIAEVFPSNVDKKEHDGEIAVRLCNYTDVYYNDLITDDLKFMKATASPEQITKFTLRSGDVILTKDSETADDIAIPAYVPFDLPGVVCGYHLSIARPRAIAKGAFLMRALEAVYVKAQAEVAANGLTRVGLSQYALDSLLIASPEGGEQSQIALFLDQETAKIDALIEEQRRLIELLKEKRWAVISHAVTKGLNPDAPMKHTGDKWLGSIPDHWAVVAAKYVSTIFVPQRNKPELNQEGDGIPWITMDQMKGAELANSGYWVSKQAAEAAGTRTLKRGAVIASCVGNFGASSVNLCDVVINQQLQAFIPNDRIRTSFLRYRVESSKSYFEEIGTAATIPYVNQQGFAALPVPLPPLSEQDEIVAHLDHAIAEMDHSITLAADAVVLLRERRAALISAAVTGKIDVRNYTPREVA